MNSTDEQHFLTGKRIIVVGAGIGGLTFCIALQQFLDEATEKIEPPPSIIVIERDTSADTIGREGYSLSIRADPLSGGMQTLQNLRILDEMIAESNPSNPPTLFNADFSSLMEFQSRPGADLSQFNMRIARSKLREILIKHLPSSVTVNWNCAVKSAQELEDGQILVDLCDGTQKQCHLLIVADGSNSTIRRVLRSEHVLNFTGAVCIVARTRALAKLPSPIDKAWGGVLGGNGHCLFVAPCDRTSVLWAVSYLSDTPRDRKAAGTMTDEEIDEILAETKERTKPYSEPMPTLLKETLRSSVAIYNAKDIVPLRNHGSVIFIGDAQHAVNPFSGSGANMALLDGYQLADQLIHAKDLNTAIKSYDDLSIPRSTKAINMSHWTISIAHSQGIWKYMWTAIFKIMAWYFGLNHQHAKQSH
jgi:2-polyprenyl-6-methoxyphenol hydroxylase-like FAD-dependent oxidoreductase